MAEDGVTAMDTSDVKKEIKTEDGIKKEIKSENEVSSSSGDVKPEVKAEVKSEAAKPSSSSAAAGAQPVKKAPKVTFSATELKEALLPTLMRLYHQDPESFPFRDPVDPNLLGIPDYFKIISKPMDMTTIKGNLDTGKYKDPWEYVDDVWLMFENAWVYNRKTSRVYKYCSKVRNDLGNPKVDLLLIFSVCFLL